MLLLLLPLPLLLLRLCCGDCYHRCLVLPLQLRKDINSWVAKYRRDEKFSGRPSYG